MSRKHKTHNKHTGSSLDDFLKEEGIFEEAQTQAIKEVVALQLDEAALLTSTSEPAKTQKQIPHPAKTAGIRDDRLGQLLAQGTKSTKPMKR